MNSSVIFEDPLSVPNHLIRIIAWIAAVFWSMSGIVSNLITSLSSILIMDVKEKHKIQRNM